VSGGDGMNSVLEYILSDKHWLLRLRPFVPGSYGYRFRRPGVGNAYPFEGSPRGAGFSPWVDGRGWMVSQVVKFWLSELIVGWRSEDANYSWD
jgi:hypothetical protein